jgi:hypothetical protein
MLFKFFNFEGEFTLNGHNLETCKYPNGLNCVSKVTIKHLYDCNKIFQGIQIIERRYNHTFISNFHKNFTYQYTSSFGSSKNGTFSIIDNKLFVDAEGYSDSLGKFAKFRHEFIKTDKIINLNLYYFDNDSWKLYYESKFSIS